MLDNRIKDAEVYNALIVVDDAFHFKFVEKEMAGIFLRHMRHDFGADLSPALRRRDEWGFR